MVQIVKTCLFEVLVSIDYQKLRFNPTSVLVISYLLA